MRGTRCFARRRRSSMQVITVMGLLAFTPFGVPAMVARRGRHAGRPGAWTASAGAACEPLAGRRAAAARPGRRVDWRLPTIEERCMATIRTGDKAVLLVVDFQV